MKSILPKAGILAASIAAAPASPITVDTVGTINGNARTVLEATGNSHDVTTCASNIATAYANNTGGVWNFDGAAFSVGVGETITLKYGTSLAKSVVLTLSSGNTIDRSNIPGETSSGDFQLGLVGDASTRTFTLSKPLVELGIISTNRNDAARLPVLTVTFQDTTTASTSGANANAWYFHGFTGSEANPIVSFSISQNAFVRYDDLAFIVAAESDVDSDGDGVSDADEISGILNSQFGFAPTDPNNPDSDGDGMSDGYELANNTPGAALNPNDDGTTDPTQAPGADRDGDGLSNIEEFDPSQGPNPLSPQTRADLADTDNDGLSDLVENNSGFWDSENATGTSPTNPDTDGDGLLDGQENYDLLSYPGAGVFPTNSDPNLADTDGDGYNDKFEADNGFDPNDPNVPVRATVGVINPDAVTNGQTVVDSPENVGNASFLTVAAMETLMTTEFAANNGGVVNWDTAQGWVANASALSFDVKYGASATHTLTITRDDGGGPNVFGATTGSPVTSGNQHLGFSSQGSPMTLTFSQGLTAWGITQLNRLASRTVTMSFTLADNTVVNYAPQDQDPNSDNTDDLNWYGFQATEANPLMKVTMTADGFTRFDDMAFVVSGSAGGYTAWANANGATGQTKDQDHDNDGVVNGIEYFMGETGSTFTANPAAVSGTVTWPMGATYSGVYGTDYEVQYSTNLVNWTKALQGTGDNTVTVTAGTSVVYDMPTGGKSFVRLVVKN